VVISRADVSFQYEFSVDKLDADDEVCNMQLFDYNDDDIEEIFIGYSNENVLKLVCYDLSGNNLFTHVENLQSDAEFQKFTLVEDGDIDKLVTVSNFSSSEDEKKFMVRLYDLYNMSLIDSLIYQVPYPTYDGTDPLNIKTILTTWYDSNLFIYIGYIYTWVEQYWMGYDEYFASYITKISYSDSLSYVENLEECGDYLNQMNDSLIISIGSFSWIDNGDQWASFSKSYYLNLLSNELNSNIYEIFNTSGYCHINDEYVWYHYPLQFFILSKNNLNSNFFGNTLYYKTYDSAIGNKVTFKNYSCDFSEILWEMNDTQTSYDNIGSRSCVEVYSEDKFLIYFRTDSLEIRDRVNGNIYYHQESSIIPYNILRMSDGELLLFVDRDDDNGYDVYTLDGPFFGIDQNNNIGDDRIAVNYPNPFHESTTFSFTSKEPIENAEIKIYNVKGQLIRELTAFPSASWRIGTSSVVWDGRNEYGNEVKQGIYLYKCIFENKNINGKMMKLQ
jgi:hypothetical protein